MLGLGLGNNKYKTTEIIGSGISELPTISATLLAWYKFDSDLVLDTSSQSISNGETVGTVQDSSGNGFTLGDHPLVGPNPTWGESVLNGYPGLVFSGNHNLHNNDILFISTQPYVVMVVGNSTASTGYFIDSQRLGTRGICGVVNDQYRMFAGTNISGGVRDSNFHYHLYTFNGASSTIRVDGSVVLSGNPGTIARQGITVGSSEGGATDLTGNILEIAMWNGSFTAGDYSAIETYCSNKYAL